MAIAKNQVVILDYKLQNGGPDGDLIEETFGSQFEISNPNSTSACGCGESFGV